MDVVIIGAGPAGATAARLLAAAGRRVLLLDKAAFPRHKSCGGGIPKRTRDQLGFELPASMTTPVHTVALDGAVTGRQVFPVQGGTVVVDRAAFDHYLVRQAVAAGAGFRDGSPVINVSRDTAGFTVTLPGGQVDAPILCVADGVFSPVGRQLGFPANRTGFCVEAVVPYPEGVTEEARYQAVFNLTCLRRGYAWCFPRHDGFAIGIGGAYQSFPQLPEKLRAFALRTPQLHGLTVGKVHGGLLPDFTDPREHYTAPGVYLLGDAAGLVDPLSGEGIYYAVRSGLLAAAAILAGGVAQYEATLRQELLPELMTARRRARLFHGLPPWLRACGMSLPLFRRRAYRFIDLLEGRG